MRLCRPVLREEESMEVWVFKKKNRKYVPARNVGKDFTPVLAS